MRAPEETVSPQVTHIGAIAKMDPVFTHTTLAPFQEHNGHILLQLRWTVSFTNTAMVITF